LKPPHLLHRLMNLDSRGAPDESISLMLGKLLADSARAKRTIASLSDVEFRVFSQWGDDGIIQWLLSNVEFPNETFVEFGVGDYSESNTRFLMMNDNWSGLVMDSSEENIARIVASDYYWRHDLSARAAFVDRDNVNGLIAERGFDREVGILHIDLDGMDYWVWEAISQIDPAVTILEYNAVFGIDRAITVPYDPAFQRTRAHASNLYFGASLGALHHLSKRKGYAFIGCSSAGNNAYFVREDKLNGSVREVSLSEGFVPSKFRESRDENGELTYASGAKRFELIAGMPVVNVLTGGTERL
jgi:hypothetical protein